MSSGFIQKEYDDQYKQQAADLVGKMTLEEKVLNMLHGAAEVSHLDVPAYNWWNEALHGVARAGVATVFPQAIGLAATFDPELLEAVADTVSTEGRAKYEAACRHGDRDIYKGLTFWSPNINIFRDPRWGRGHETYGEDPWLTAELGKAFIKGIQGKDPRYLKAAACAKHFAVHSGPEGLRHHFDAETSMKDLWETYLYAFEECVVDGQVESVMGAYNRTNGDACCAHPYLLQTVLREMWHFDGHVTSDCWAIKDINEGHAITRTLAESSALAVSRGCDLNCGNAYHTLLSAVDDGLITEGEIDRSLTRLMTARYRLGILGDAQDSPFTGIPYTVVDCENHRRQNLEAARRSLVLLHNDGLLPLNRDEIKTIAVIGPNADNLDALLGNYCGTPNEYFTPLRGITEEVNPGTRVLYSQGCHLFKPATSNLPQENNCLSEVLSCAEAADAVVLCLGLDAFLEGEEGDTSNPFSAGDKPDLNLPGIQQKVLDALLATNKPVIVVLLAGSALAVNTAAEKAAAVIQAWYPGAMGGKALAQLIFGDYSPSGRLPVTFYQTSEELPDICDYSMENRTYRYMQQRPLYPFGFGLSYTSFAYSAVDLAGLDDLHATKPADRNDHALSVSIDVTNTGSRAGREVVQLYLAAPGAGQDQPRYQLRGVCPIWLEPGKSRKVTLELLAKHLWSVAEDGSRRIKPGQYQVFVGGSQPDERSQELTGAVPCSTCFTVQD